MANFSTHLNVSAFISGISAVSISYTNLATPKDAFVYFFAGMIGGILPDIDHNNSTPIKIMQFFFSNLIAFLVMFKFVNKVPILNLLLIWISCYIAINICFYFFKKFTTHRGMIHSLPAGMTFALISSLISYKVFNLPLFKSYLLGIFLFLGYLTHLILDEIYSVDITGKKLKKSFGSAFKFWSNNKKANFFTYSILILLVFSMPKKEVLFNLIKGIINV